MILSHEPRALGLSGPERSFHQELQGRLPRVGMGTYPDKDREWGGRREGDIHTGERDLRNRGC